MLLAKIENGVIVEVAEHSVMFPNTSFVNDTPDQDFMDAMGVLEVVTTLPYGPATEKLVSVEPHFVGDEVRNVEVRTMLQPEIDAKELARKQAKIAEFTAEAGRRLDDFAKARGYGSIISVCSYKGSSVPRFASDADIAMALRDQWWAILNEIVADVLAGTRAEPATFNDIVGELPALTWS